MVKIVVIEDHKLIREMWINFLSNQQGISVVGDSGEFDEGLDMIKSLRPDFVLLDINLNSSNGIEMITPIRKFSPGTCIIIVTMHTQKSIIKKVVALGAKGYITKNSNGEELLNAISEIQKGNIYLSKDISEPNKTNSEEIKNNGIELLSLREVEIIKLIKSGFLSKEIAEKLFISTRTVETHRANIFKKLHLNNTVALLAFLNYSDIE